METLIRCVLNVHNIKGIGLNINVFFNAPIPFLPDRPGADPDILRKYHSDECKIAFA